MRATSLYGTLLSLVPTSLRSLVRSTTSNPEKGPATRWGSRDGIGVSSFKSSASDAPRDGLAQLPSARLDAGQGDLAAKVCVRDGIASLRLCWPMELATL